MPSGDVTPETSPRARPSALVDGARPYNTVDASLPIIPAPVPAAPYVDKKEFPAMTPSPYMGVGGIKGTKDQPKATTVWVPAFTRPADGKVPPRAVPGSSKVATKPSSSVSSKGTTKTQKAAANLKGRDAGQPQVNVTRMTDQQVAAAQQSVRRSPQKHDPESKQGQVESMDTTPQSDAKKDSEGPKKLSKDKGQRDQSSERKEKRDRSGSLTRKELKKKEDGRQTVPASANRTGRTESLPTTSKGPTVLTSTLTEAGGAKPPGDKVGVIPRRPDGRGRRPVDYNTETLSRSSIPRGPTSREPSRKVARCSES